MGFADARAKPLLMRSTEGAQPAGREPPIGACVHTRISEGLRSSPELCVRAYYPVKLRAQAPLIRVGGRLQA